MFIIEKTKKMNGEEIILLKGLCGLYHYKVILECVIGAIEAIDDNNVFEKIHNDFSIIDKVDSNLVINNELALENFCNMINTLFFSHTKGLFLFDEFLKLSEKYNKEKTYTNDFYLTI